MTLSLLSSMRILNAPDKANPPTVSVAPPARIRKRFLWLLYVALTSTVPATPFALGSSRGYVSLNHCSSSFFATIVGAPRRSGHKSGRRRNTPNGTRGPGRRADFLSFDNLVVRPVLGSHIESFLYPFSKVVSAVLDNPIVGLAYR